MYVCVFGCIYVCVNLIVNLLSSYTFVEKSVIEYILVECFIYNMP